MRKFTSSVLTLLLALNLSIIESFSLGVNKIKYGKGSENGQTFVYVSSDKIEDYINGLQQESEKCFAEYNDWYKDHTWKGIFHLSHVYTFPIIAGLISYFPLKKLFLTPKTNLNRVDIPQEDTPNVQPTKSSNIVRHLLFSVAFGAIDAIAGFTGFLFTKNNLPHSKWLDCVFLKDTNNDLIKELQNLSNDCKTYGVKIRYSQGHSIKWFERPFLPLWQKKGECMVVGSQKGFYNPRSKYYDPKLAAEVKENSTIIK